LLLLLLLRWLGLSPWPLALPWPEPLLRRLLARTRFYTEPCFKYLSVTAHVFSA